MPLSPFWEKVEHYNSKLIPPCIILLLAIIVIEVFMHVEEPKIKLGVKIADILIITIFLIDLVFLFIKSHEQGHTIKQFIRKYWLDILAVLPFGLVAEGIGKSAVAITAAEQVTMGQGVIHESLEITKAASRTEKIAKVARGVKIGTRMVKVITKGSGIERFKRKIAKYI